MMNYRKNCLRMMLGCLSLMAFYGISACKKDTPSLYSPNKRSDSKVDAAADDKTNNEDTTIGAAAGQWTQAALLETNHDGAVEEASATFLSETSAVVAWSQVNSGVVSIWAKIWKNNNWSNAEVLGFGPAGTRAYKPVVGYTGSGEAVVSWYAWGKDTNGSTVTSEIYSRVWSPTSGWNSGAYATVSTASPQGNHEDNQDLASNCGGDVIAAWQEEAHGIWVNRYANKQGWGTPVRISGDLPTGRPVLACDSVGNVIVMWGQGGSGGPWWSRWKAGASSWENSQQIGAAYAGILGGLSVASDGKGGFITSWVQNDATGGENKVYGASSFDDFANPSQINADVKPKIGNPVLTADQSGNMTVIWTHLDGDAALWSVQYQASNQSWSSPLQVNPGGASVDGIFPEIIYGHGGGYLATWVENNPTGFNLTFAHQVKGQWSAKAKVSDVDLKIPDHAHLVHNGKGTVLVVWLQQESGIENLWHSFMK